MTLVTTLLALGLVAGPAEAKKKKDGMGVRLKVSSDLLAVESSKQEYDGSDVDGSDARTNTISLFEHGQRFEATYFLGDGVEVGGMLGFTQARGTVGDTEDPPDRHFALALTGAYNMGLGGGVRGFVQPIAGIDQTTVDVGEDFETQVRFLMAGADAGVRIKLNKKVTFDIAGEGLIGNGKASAGGESDDKLKLKYNKVGARIGLSVRI